MQVWYHLHAVRAFLEYLELNSHPYRTGEPVQKVIGTQHMAAPKSLLHSSGDCVACNGLAYF